MCGKVLNILKRGQIVTKMNKASKLTSMSMLGTPTTQKTIWLATVLRLSRNLFVSKTSTLKFVDSPIENNPDNN